MKLTKNFSKNFSKSEFECRCGCEMPDDVLENVKKLAEQLQIIRDYVQEPIIINSAYRCLRHNKMIGSNDRSQHPKGKAADIVIMDFTPDETASVIENMLTNETLPSFHIGGLGRYNTFTHVDIRENDARWDNRSKL